MRTRLDVLENAVDIGVSGTKTYNLDYQDPISELSLIVAATNGASGNKDAPIERCITKIEIVDGGEVLWDLPGDVAYALATQLCGKPFNTYNTGALSDSPYVEIPLQFGRHLWDPQLAFLPTKFSNPQLKFTFDEATVRAAGNTGFVSDSFTLTIMAKLMENAGAPQGYLRAHDVHDFTSVASGDEPVDLPLDMPIRMLMVRAYEDGVAMDATLTNYELNCDGGKFKPFDLPTARLMDLMTEMFPEVHREGYDHATSAEVFQTWMALNVGQLVHAHDADVILAASSFWPSRFTATLYNGAGSTLVEKPIHWSVWGWAPHNTLFIPFGRLNEPGEWFTWPETGKARLLLTQGNPGAEVNVCVQQLAKY